MHHLVPNPFEEGVVLLINKPLDWTSFDATRKVRNLVGIKKVGHAGTLDPLATGLLIICTGRFTKRINEFMGAEKEYTGSITLGASTVTYDLESEPGNLRDISGLTERAIREMTGNFTGEIMQIPPAHSAIKKGGVRAYELARAGKEIALEPRNIRISAFDITKIELPKVYFRVICSTGTYIRSLAHDFGKALDCGGYLSSLCRIRIGEYRIQQAMTMGEAENWIRQKRLGIEPDQKG
jgi:tRNA pseudouridine55 synthase